MSIIHSEMKQDHQKPLVVDLDGTLIKTDLLLESTNHFLAQNLFNCFKLAFCLLETPNRADFKAKLAKLSQIDVSVLPYNPAVIAWLKAEKAQGRKIILATASHKILADQVASHLGLFDEVLATEGTHNLKAENKRDLLVKMYGTKGFDYIGNSNADFPVWQASHSAYVVSNSDRFISRVKKISNVTGAFRSHDLSRAKAILKSLRLHQWVKNLLIVIPLLAAHQFNSYEKIEHALLAFLTFGLTASSVYVLNDLVDVHHDRHHKKKKNRPFASGELSLITGWTLALTLLLIVIFLLQYLPVHFGLVLSTYYFITLCYSLKLKQVALLDVLTLAGLYTIRLIAGSVAISVPLSFWLLTFSMFLFLSLALVKRASELQIVGNQQTQIRGRGYTTSDLPIVTALGITAGYLAVLVLALYIQDPNITIFYTAPKILWLSCPLLLLWISRVWLLTQRGQMDEDPIVFAIKDKVSLMIGMILIATFFSAKIFFL